MELTEEKLTELKNRFGIAGNSEKLNYALRMAVRVAPADITVLLAGESGAGKEAFSKLIHHLSPRKHSHFIPVNCGAIPQGTIDSELFGHEKGAFTSAHESRKGYFETANGGTIFLDEVGEMPMSTQSRLLRTLENGEFIRVGSSKVRKTDVRVVTATNKDLLESVRQNKFREDLYYRLSTVTLRVPPLRERPEDIPFLFAKFVSEAEEKFQVPPLELDESGEQALMAYKWPGNIRQLKNVIEQIAILEKGRRVDAPTVNKYLPEDPGEEIKLHEQKGGESEDQFQGFEEREMLYKFLFEIKRDISELKDFFNQLFKNSKGYYSGDFSGEPSQEAPKYINPPQYDQPPYREESPSHTPPPDREGFQGTSPPVEDPIEASVETEENEDDEEFSLAEKEKEMIAKALKKFKGKRKLAARELGISERTLYRKIKRYDLEDL